MVFRVLFLWLLVAVAPTPLSAGDVFNHPTVSDVPALVSHLQDADVRQGASNALVRLGKPAVAELTAAMGSKNVELQIWSAYTLGRIGSDAEASAAALIMALGSNDHDLRATATRALGQIGSAHQDVVKGLTESLLDDQPTVRQAAAEALGRLGPSAQAAVPQLVEALHDLSIRKHALAALTRIGEEATPTLLVALKDNTIRLEAAEALRHVNPAAARQAGVESITAADLAALKIALANTNNDTEARALAAEQLGALGSEAVPVLIAAFDDDVTAVRRAASAAFQNIGVAGIPALQESLRHESPRVRAATADAIAAIGLEAGQAVSDLAEALSDSERDVRYRVAAALDQLGAVADDAADALISVVLNEREQEATRQLAIKALGQTSPAVREQVTAALLEAQKVNNFGVSKLAEDTLKSLSERP